MSVHHFPEMMDYADCPFIPSTRTARIDGMEAL